MTLAYQNGIKNNQEHSKFRECLLPSNSTSCLNVSYLNSYRLKYTALQLCPQSSTGTKLGLSYEERYKIQMTVQRVAILTGFCQSIHANAMIVPQIKPHPLSHTSLQFPIQYNHSTQHATESVIK
jgi:hypothetical protein